MRGYSEDKAGYLKRLRRVEGQVRGLQRMIENDDYCIDILTQISAATKALQAVSLGLLEQHLGHCVSEAIAEGGESAEAKLRGQRRHRPSHQVLTHVEAGGTVRTAR
jgi:DNA-binding FrmR family transcriptional regulator